MNILSTEAKLSELKGLESTLKENFETRIDTTMYSFDRTYFDMENERIHLFYDHNQNKGYTGKEFILNLKTMNCQDINYTSEKIGETIQRKKQQVRYFALDCSTELYKQLKALFPIDPIEEAENAALEDFENSFDTDFDVICVDDPEKCKCGGSILPMYEEHPSWIQFCNHCDIRTEDGDFSPLHY